MALIRGHHAFDDHFTQIPNDWVRDERLSLEARGLVAQIMSHRPGWNLSIKSLAARNHVGRDKVRRILDELLTHGYLERSEKQAHDDLGHLAGFDYTTKDPHGVAQEPCKAEPTKAEPTKADGPPKKTIPLEQHLDKKTIDIESAFNKFWAVYPKKTDKRLALKSFVKALKRETLEPILDGAMRYRDDPNRDDSFTKNPSTWLNADAWENGPEPVRGRKLTNAENAALLAQKYRGQEQVKAIESPDVDFGGMLKGVN